MDVWLWVVEFNFVCIRVERVFREYVVFVVFGERARDGGCVMSCVCVWVLECVCGVGLSVWDLGSVGGVYECKWLRAENVKWKLRARGVDFLLVLVFVFCFVLCCVCVCVFKCFVFVNDFVLFDCLSFFYVLWCVCVDCMLCDCFDCVCVVRCLVFFLFWLNVMCVKWWLMMCCVYVSCLDCVCVFIFWFVWWCILMCLWWCVWMCVCVLDGWIK